MELIIVPVIVAIIGSGALNTIITALINSKAKKKEDHDGVREGMRLILKDRLRFLCIVYIEQGWIYEDELEDIMAMHKCYHDGLGGNGYLDTLISKVKALEVRGIGIH